MLADSACRSASSAGFSLSPGHAVFAQLREQLIHLLTGLLDFRLVPYGHDDGRERLGIFLRGSTTLLIVAGVQVVQCLLPLCFVSDQLNQAVLFVVALINLLR